MLAPQPWIETHLQVLLPAAGDRRRADHAGPRRARQASRVHENTIVVFSSDHGDMQGAHGGMHEKWHVAYEEALRVPFIVSEPARSRRAARGRDPDQPRRPDPDAARPRRASITTRRSRCCRATTARPGRSSDAISRARSAATAGGPGASPILFTTDDEISEGSAPGRARFQGSRGALARYSRRRPAEPHGDGRRRGRGRRRTPPGQVLAATTTTSSSGRCRGSATNGCAAAQDDHRHRARARRVRALRPHARSLSRSATSPTRRTPDRTRRGRCRQHMLGLLVEQLDAKRLAPSARARSPATGRPPLRWTPRQRRYR